MNQKHILRKKRHTHIRRTLSGSESKPRLCVYRSNAHIYAQIIDDVNHKTLAEASDVKIEKGTHVEKAKEVGLNIAKLAKKVNIETVVFDRAGYKFHGRVKSLAEGAREGGLQF